MTDKEAEIKKTLEKKGNTLPKPPQFINRDSIKQWLKALNKNQGEQK